MDPITFGMVSIGATGGSLIVASLLKRWGISINEEAIKLTLETAKYGGILYLMYHLSKIFL